MDIGAHTSHKEDENYEMVIELTKIAKISLVTNAWPARHASAVVRIEYSQRSTIKGGLLNALLQILLNGPKLGSPNETELHDRVTTIQ